MGFEDTVVNHILLMKDLAENTIKRKDIERRVDRSLLSRRAFTVQCICNMETLTLTQSSIDTMKKDFRTPMVKFIKQNIQQTLNIFCQLIHMIENFDKPKSRVMDFCSPFNETQAQTNHNTDKIIKHWLRDYQHEAVFEILWTDPEDNGSSSSENEEIGEVARVAGFMHALKEQKTFREQKDRVRPPS